jgi:hypothetical protein
MQIQQELILEIHFDELLINLKDICVCFIIGPLAHPPNKAFWPPGGLLLNAGVAVWSLTMLTI